MERNTELPMDSIIVLFCIYGGKGLWEYIRKNKYAWHVWGMKTIFV